MAKTRSRRFCSETMFPSQNTHWFGFPYKSFNNLFLIIEWEGDVVGPGGIWGQVQGVGSDHWGTRSHPWGRLRMGWPLKARRSLFPYWLWLCDESSPHRHKEGLCPFLFKFWRENSKCSSYQQCKSFPVAQICPNSRKKSISGRMDLSKLT